MNVNPVFSSVHRLLANVRCQEICSKEANRRFSTFPHLISWSTVNTSIHGALISSSLTFSCSGRTTCRWGSSTSSRHTNLLRVCYRKKWKNNGWVFIMQRLHVQNLSLHHAASSCSEPESSSLTCGSLCVISRSCVHCFLPKSFNMISRERWRRYLFWNCSLKRNIWYF